MKFIPQALTRHVTLSSENKAKNVVKSFSLVEKLIFGFLLLIFCLSAVIMLLEVNENFKVTIPARGGTLTEGIVGFPRFINPVLAMSDVDKDLSTLIYSGLMKISPSGTLERDLAASYTISEDKTVYTFNIRPDATFHDGTPITSDDFVFTVQKFLDPAMKSPKRANLEGIKVEKKDTRTITFTLKKPYSGFLEILTFGVLPEHIWKNVTTENFPFSIYNIEPIGSGPYKINGTERDSGGILLSYSLGSFDKDVNDAPFIDNFVIYFYSNEDDLMKDIKKGNINTAGGISTENASLISKDYYTITSTPLARSFGVFFNQSQSGALKNIEVRTALAQAVDREQIIKEALNGYGTALYGPIPSISVDTPVISTLSDKLKNQDIAAARQILFKNGWSTSTDGILEKKPPVSKTKGAVASDAGTIRLEFSISTSNSPDLKKTAEILKSQWEPIGAKVNIKVFELGDLNQNVIRPRKYDVLLFGEVIGRDLDLYAFWHSSQRTDPGLNIAGFMNADSDKILDDMRSDLNKESRNAKLSKWAEIFKTELPAIFLYSPEYIYSVSNNVKGAELKYISRSSDRWNGIEKWYVKTDNVWKPLVKIFENK